MKFQKLYIGFLFFLIVGCSQGSNSGSVTKVQSENSQNQQGKPVHLQGVEITPPSPAAGQPLMGVVQARDIRQLAPLLRYQWMKDGAPIQGETSNTLQGHQFQKGDEVSIQVSYLDPAGNENIIVSNPVSIENSLPVVTSMSYNPESPRSNHEIKAIVQSSDADQDPVNYTFRWFVNDEEIDGEDSASLSNEFTNKGDSVVVEVTPYDGEESGTPLKSFPVQIMNSPPAITSNPPFSINGEGIYEYQIEAADPDGDSLQYEVAAGPAGMTVDPQRGFLSWKPEEKDIGSHSIEVAAVDTDGARGIQKYDLEIFLIEAAVR